MKIVFGGASGYEQVPGLDKVANRCDIAFAPDDAALRAHLPEAEVFVSWTYTGSGLEKTGASQSALNGFIGVGQG
jgi:hypothetical protein